MKALVIGGNGFIGSHLIDHLLDLNDDVRVLDIRPEKYRPPLPNVEYVLAEFGDPFFLAESLSGIDIVYHLASSTVPGTSNLNPTKDIKDNLVGTVCLLEQMVKAGVRRIVYLSSGGTVYGMPSRIPIPEDHALNPICSYGIVKAAVEKYLFMFEQLYGVAPIILRPSNAFGPRQGHLRVQGVISTFLSNVKNREPFTVWGDGSVVRDYIYVQDLVELAVKAGHSDIKGIYNAASCRGYSVMGIIERVSSITGLHYGIKFEEGRSFDIQEVILSIDKAGDVFDWSPRVDLEDGILKQWRWLRER